MNRRRGFSLVEVVVATTVFCAGSVISYPAMLTFKAATVTRSAVEQIVTDLHHAQAAAINANSFAVVQLKADRYSVFIDDGANGKGEAGDWHQQEGERTVLSRTLPAGMSLSSNFHSPEDKLRFRGVAGIKAGSITVNGLKEISYKLALSRAGRLRTEKL